MLLQRIELGPAQPELPHDLWVRRLSGSEIGSVANEPHQLQDAERLRFDTYFGSLFVDYWAKLTTVQAVSVRFQLAGDATIAVRHQVGSSISTVAEERVSIPAGGSTTADGWCEVGPITLAALESPGGRLWCEVTAHDRCSVVGGEWWGEAPQRSEVSLGVVICTFNRQDDLRRNLDALARSQSAGVVDRLLVINQGDDLGLTADLIELLGNRFRFEVISQSNLGGCGGFTRGMYELSSDQTTTHLVLLDDDVTINPESFERVAALYSLGGPPKAIGGHMLDRFAPDTLYESGADLDPNTGKAVARHHNVAVTRSDELERWDRVASVGYNGWWFFAVPVTEIRRTGLPVPCFVRGDDVEYGVRLGEDGIATFAVPGVALWHEPFYVKLANWQHYFDIRNRLTMIAIHRNGSIRRIKRDLRMMFHRDALLSRYHSCEYLLQALRDHLCGPERCIDTSDHALKWCHDVFETLGPRLVSSDPSPVEVRGGRRGRWRVPLRRVARLVAPVRSDRRSALLDSSTISPFRSDLFHGYRIRMDEGNVWEFNRNPQLERQQWIEFERLIARWRGPTFDDSIVERGGSGAWFDWWASRFAGGDLAWSYRPGGRSRPH